VSEHSPAERHRAMTWAQRLKRVFRIDIESCERCGGKVRIIASVEDPAVIGKILAHLEHRLQVREEPPAPAASCSARNPPSRLHFPQCNQLRYSSARVITGRRHRAARLHCRQQGRPVDRLVMCHSEFIPCEIKCAMEDAEYRDTAVISDQVGDAVVAIQENANIPRRSPVAVPDLRELPEQLGPFIDAVNRPRCRLRAIGGDVFVDVLEPALCF